MDMEKIDHVGIAVRNLQSSINIYKSLGMKVSDIEEIKEQKVNVAFIDIGKNRIELLEPTSPESAIAKFIEKKGEGIHHLAIRVKNLKTILAEYQERGIRLIDKTPRAGSHGLKIAFVHPKYTDGVLLELCEKA